VRGDERTTRQARDFLLRHTDSGGTELGVALEQALGQQRDSTGRARHVVIVTDAQVSDAGRIMALVEREAGRPDRRRVDVLCIDAAPNSGLANELAERGGGLARFLTSDPAENDIASALDEVLADWAAPILRNLTLQIDRPGVQAAGRRVSSVGDDQSAVDLGDLPAGRAIWVAGRVGDGLGRRAGGAPTFRLLADGQEIAADRPSPDATAANHPAVPPLFGARRVLDVELAQTSGVELEERLRQLGYDPREVLKPSGPAADAPIYAENARQHSTDALHDLLVRESLHYGIACSATAFVATRREAGERVAGTVAVANALAHGWSSDFLTAGMAASGMMLRMAAPTFMPAPMAAPPPAPGTAAPPSRAGGLDLGGLVSGPLDAARDLARRFREGGRSQRYDAAGASPGAPAEELSSGGRGGLTVVFAGAPSFSGGEAVLFDSQSSRTRLPSDGTLARLVVRLGDRTPAASIDSDLTLALYVDDLTAPRARVRLADLLRQGGERPLNVRRQSGQVVRIVLLDPNGAWAAGAPALEVALG
jgi:Ca-activated chloride channel family protein